MRAEAGRLQLESLFAAALALLMDQIRSTANSATVSASLARLESIARLGSLRLDEGQLRGESLLDTATSVGAALVANAMDTHQLVSIEVHRAVSRDECLALARALQGSPPLTRAESPAVFRNALWNVKVETRVPATAAASAPHASTPAAGTVLQQASVAEKDGNPHAMLAVLTAVGPDSLFRAAATPRGLQLVAEIVVNPGYEALPAAMAVLERAGEEGVRAVFKHLVDSQDAGERRRCFDACRELGSGVRVFQEYLGHPLWYVVRNAALLLGETATAAAVPALSRLLKHDEVRVRVAAATALGQIGGPDARSRLETALHDESHEVRQQAMSVLFANQEHWSERYAKGGASDGSGDGTLRLEMVRALGRMGTESAAQKLQAMAEGRSPDATLELRLAAMDALAEGHRATALRLLPKFAFDPAQTVRAKAAQLLR